MMIAIPTFGARVSPRFDCAQQISVVTVVDGRCSQRLELAASGWAPHERIDQLLELGVDTVICGGIDRWTSVALQSAGVTIYGWVTGEAEHALDALLKGELDREAARQGGGRCRCRRFAAQGNGQSEPTGGGRCNRGRGGMGRRQGRGRPAGA